MSELSAYYTPGAGCSHCGRDATGIYGDGSARCLNCGSILYERPPLIPYDPARPATVIPEHCEIHVGSLVYRSTGPRTGHFEIDGREVAVRNCTIVINAGEPVTATMEFLPERSRTPKRTMPANPARPGPCII